MKKKADLVKEWLTKADHDLQAAKSLLKAKEPLLDIIAFHCQQAVEKYLKGYMVYLDLAFTKTHEIGDLIAIIEEKDPEMIHLKERADTLTDYAVEIRYPESYIMPSQEEINQAIEIAYEIQTYVKSKTSETNT
ncbi:MAG: HEPN domain-containing protein [bacterium]|nr:HEPN domain-containing protein [bacterium]